jgi:glucose-6-phosphate 1-dehydrogenase
VDATEVFVKLKRPPLRKQTVESNYFRFRLGPDFSLNVGAQVKRPGSQMVSMPVELSVIDRDKVEEDRPYARLLTDAMHGNKLLFVREDAVEAAWMVVDPILDNPVPLNYYRAGTWGPEEADRLAKDVRGWRNPKASSL